MTSSLRRQLGFTAVTAVVAGDILGSGIFFTPGELAPIAQHPWQVYFFWGLCGVITLCGALTLAELSSLFPRSGATYHIIREGFGPLLGFLKVWTEMWVSGPGSVAAVAILFGEFFREFLGSYSMWPASIWGIAAIVAFTVINLMGIRWGGLTQIILTSVKIGALLGLVFGSFLLADATSPPTVVSQPTGAGGLTGFIRLVGLGVGAVLFTYDGWVDVSHVAGEVRTPRKNLPAGLFSGVGMIIILYLVTNYAYLRIVPLGAMAETNTLVAVEVARATFGDIGTRLITALIMVSILGALGGLIMTLPRLLFAGASQYKTQGPSYNPVVSFFQGLSAVSSRRAVPVGALLFTASISIIALLFFQSFSRVVNFFVVSNYFFNILMVAAVFRFRKRGNESRESYRTPGYPFVPIMFIVTIGSFLASAIYYRPEDTLIGVMLTATGIPFYLWINKKEKE